MRAQRIARMEFRRVARSPGIWIAAGVFAIALSVGAALPSLAIGTADPAIGVAFLLGPATDLVLPLLAIVLSYAAVAGQRERGTTKLLLGMPHRRDDVLYGIIGGRVAVLNSIVVLGSVLAALAIWLLYGRPPIRPIAGFFAITILAASSFTVVGVAVSAACRTQLRSAAVLIAGFALAYALWEPLTRGIYYLVRGELPRDEPARWVTALNRLNPLEAYARALDGILPPSPHLSLAIEQGTVDADHGGLVGGEIATGDLVLSLVVLVGWMVLAVFGARYRFRRTEFT